MQLKFLFIFLQLICLICLQINFINCHLSYKYRNRNRSRGLSSHNAQALIAAESTSSSSNTNSNNHQQQSQIECDFLLHKETGCEEGSKCDAATSKCVCKDSHPIRLLDFCLKISRLNGPCYTSGQCSVIANASCYIFGKEYDIETGSGSHNLGRFVKNWPLGVCKCRLGFAYNLTTNQCEKRLVGSFCSSNSHCLLRSLNSVCDKKRDECECSWGTRYEPKLDTCVPDTATNSINNNGNPNIGYGLNNRQIYYMSKCEQDIDCSVNPAIPSLTPNLSVTNQHQPSGIPPTSPLSVTSPTTLSQKSSNVASSSTVSPLLNNNLNQQQQHHSANNQIQPTASVENDKNNNLMLEQADQESMTHFNQIRYLHGHRRLKDSLRRMNGNYHLKELQCIRGRCVCASLHHYDGHLHCKVPYDLNQSNYNGTHRHNRKNHNTFSDLDDELNDEFDDGSINYQTVFLVAIGSSLLAGLIFRYCYYRRGEDDDELSEGLRSPDGLYAHKSALGREFNPVTVAFLSKPNPLNMNGASCASNHYDPNYGYLSSAPGGCYVHDYVYDAFNIYNQPPLPPHTMMGHPSLQAQNTLGKPPNEEEEDAYLEQNPNEKENCGLSEKKDDLIVDSQTNKYIGCVQCGQQIRNNLINSNLTHSNELKLIQSNQPTAACCGCGYSNNLNNLTNLNKDKAILDQYVGNGSLAGDSVNSTVGLRDVIDCVTPATTATTTCGRTSSSGNTTNEEDDENSNKSSNESATTNQLDSDKNLKDEHLSSLLTHSSNSAQTSFIITNSEEDSNEDTSDEHIAILNRKTRKLDPIKKWRTSTNSIETTTNSTSMNSSPSKSTNKSNIPFLIESQTEQFQIG